MSLKDEVREKIEMNEAADKRIKDAINFAKWDIHEARDKILSNAEYGIYKLSPDGKKIIKVYVNTTVHFRNFLEAEAKPITVEDISFFSKKTHTEYDCGNIVKDRIMYDTYMKEIKRLAAEEDMSVRPVMKYYQAGKSDYVDIFYRVRQIFSGFSRENEFFLECIVEV